MDNFGKEVEVMVLLVEVECKVKNLQFFFFGFFGGLFKIEEVCEIYVRVVNMFKMVKNWSVVGNVFCQVVQLYLQFQSKYDVVICFVDVGNVFKKVDF